MRIVYWFLLILMGLTPPLICDVIVDPAEVPALEKEKGSLYDHRARVISVKGENRILKKDEENWAAIQQDDLIDEGDRVFTREDSSVQVLFDDFHLNSLHVEENTMVEFQSIEPTHVLLSDGGLFNHLEGLREGSIYSIATPTAVAAARGTTFLYHFDASLRENEIQVESGRVEVSPKSGDGEILWDEKLALEAGRKLEFDVQEMEAADDFTKLLVVSLEPEEKMHLENLIEDLEKTLEQHAGGSEVLDQLHAEWEKTTQEEGEMKEFEGEPLPADKGSFDTAALDSLGARQLESFHPVLPQVPTTFRSAEEESSRESEPASDSGP